MEPTRLLRAVVESDPELPAFRSFRQFPALAAMVRRIRDLRLVGFAGEALQSRASLMAQGRNHEICWTGRSFGRPVLFAVPRPGQNIVAGWPLSANKALSPLITQSRGCSGIACSLLKSPLHELPGGNPGNSPASDSSGTSQNDPVSSPDSQIDIPGESSSGAIPPAVLQWCHELH